MSQAVIELTTELIGRRSLTPDDAGCQELLRARLEPLGFECETIISAGVTNLWALRRGTKTDAPTVLFAGHTDVVPTGPVAEWLSDPFVATEHNGRLYGRGASDMKSSLAAFVVAVEELSAEWQASGSEPSGSIALLITSDEEGPATDGTVKVVELLRQRGERIDYCIVGEPTSVHTLGDTIKNGRRGSLSGRLRVIGLQGHVAYPHLARNPVHDLAPALAELAATSWDDGNEFFPPTTWQVSNFHAGTGASNVIPGQAVVDFNFRFSTATNAEELQQRVGMILERHGLSYEIAWTVGGLPFLTVPGRLCAALTGAIREETGVAAELSTTGGTSDGRFIAAICPEVVEFGPPNDTIHKVNEHVELSFLAPLKNIYARTLRTLLAP